MKAIVAEIDKKQMIVITDKGDFMKVRRQMSVGIGDEIELKPQKVTLTYRRLASIAACFLMCIFLSTGVYAYYTPYSYVSVDINPSIALSLNRFERVIEINPLNEDAVSLLEDATDLKNKDIDDALSAIIESAAEKGYINAGAENQIMVVVSANNEKQEKELTEAVSSAAAKELSKVNKDSEVMVEKTTVENYKEALAHKVSPGKEILADKLRTVMPEIKDEEINNMSVKEVVHLINEGRKAIKAAEKDKDKEDSKDAEGQKDKEAAKADAKNGKDNKGSGSPKPSAAASKDNKGKNGNKDKPAAINNGNEGKDEKDGKQTTVEDNKYDKDKDTNKDDEDKKKENDENNGGPGGIGDNNGGNGPDKAGDGDKDKDKDGGTGDKDKDKDNGKKGD